ncbi:hypothetical protein N7520_000311 [Penicillium odoratum]|uniref:uncharacterized protein n=1 Tax=Penicillium odoratum TaxID=1167516 RepID=UPI0025487C2D|nr:uncharacterized protein N7520_000311 [Penicillium odoratum]KAJ5777065.1 hypothetical protein N7520_000311 [Penicillium odoratum]
MDSPDDQITSESSVWTFFLGPERNKQTIHSELARHVSPELAKFVKEKSVVKDSKVGSGSVVTLEEFDAETFAAFWAYTYRGDYKVPKPPVPRGEKDKKRHYGYSQSYKDMARVLSLGIYVLGSATTCSITTSGIRRVEPQPQIQFQPEPEPQPEQQPAEQETLTEAAADERSAENTPATPEDNGSYNENVVPVEAEAQLEPEAEVEMDPTPVMDNDAWDSPKAETNKKAKKGKKKKGKNQASEFTEEAPVNFTPPSTPPPETQADADATLDVPEQSFANPDWNESTAPESEPTYDIPAPAEPAPEPEQVAETEQPTEWEQEEYAQGTPQEQWEEEVEEEAQVPSKPSIDMSFAKQSQADSSPRTPGLSLWDEFAALQYNDEHTPTSTPSETTHKVPYLTFHAKVYVFATRFLIPSLAQLCLRKLHRDLLSLALEDTDATPIPDSQPLGDLAELQAPMVLDLLRYAYTHTERLEPISETVATQIRENELRRLVVHYASCRLKALARYHSPGDSEAGTPAVRPMDAKVERADNGPPRNLRVLLDKTPELASDVVFRMM